MRLLVADDHPESGAGRTESWSSPSSFSSFAEIGVPWSSLALSALRHANINVVVIHQHMTGEEPRMMFLHDWGIGRVDDLVKGVRSALVATQVAK